MSGADGFLEQWGDAASDGDDPFYGAGLRVNLGKIGVFGEYERYLTDQLDFDLVTLGVRITFCKRLPMRALPRPTASAEA